MHFRFAKRSAGDRLTEDAIFFKKKKIIFSDEAHFHLGGYVNTQKESLFGVDFGPGTQLGRIS